MSARVDRESGRSKGRAGATLPDAEVRSVAYALFSQLVASPRSEPENQSALPPPDLDSVTRELEARLPYAVDLEGLRGAAGNVDEVDEGNLATHYARLFEIGSDGPPVPLREELAAGRPSSSKEEVVRYYSFFGYKLVESQRWAPDHLAVELEFLHFLAFKESQATDDEVRRSYVLAQLDFLERHPLAWYSRVMEGVRESGEEAYHLALFEALGGFLSADLVWLTQTAGGRD